MIHLLPIIFHCDLENKTFDVDFSNYGRFDQLPANLSGEFNDDAARKIYLIKDDKLKIEKYIKCELPSLEINSDFEFRMQTIHKKGEEWKIDYVTKKNFTYFFKISELGVFTQNSITACENSWKIQTLNLETLSQLYIYLLLKPLYEHELSKLEKTNESQLTLEDYQTIEPEKLVKLDENIFLEFKQTAYWDEEINIKKDKMEINQFNNFKENKHILLRDQILKAICGLHNAEGGVLVIGVENDHRIVTGIEPDMENNSSFDQKEDYRKWLRNIVSAHIEEKLGLNIAVKFDTLYGKTIARVNVPRRSNNEKAPCATTYNNRKVVFKRGDEETREIKSIEILEYFKERFN